MEFTHTNTHSSCLKTNCQLENWLETHDDRQVNKREMKEGKKKNQQMERNRRLTLLLELGCVTNKKKKIQTLFFGRFLQNSSLSKYQREWIFWVGHIHSNEGVAAHTNTHTHTHTRFTNGLMMTREKEERWRKDMNKTQRFGKKKNVFNNNWKEERGSSTRRMMVDGGLFQKRRKIVYRFFFLLLHSGRRSSCSLSQEQVVTLKTHAQLDIVA